MLRALSAKRVWAIPALLLVSYGLGASAPVSPLNPLSPPAAPRLEVAPVPDLPDFDLAAPATTIAATFVSTGGFVLLDAGDFATAAARAGLELPAIAAGELTVLTPGGQSRIVPLGASGEPRIGLLSLVEALRDTDLAPALWHSPDGYWLTLGEATFALDFAGNPDPQALHCQIPVPSLSGRFSGYRGLERIEFELKDLARDHGDIARLLVLGHSYQGRPIYALKLSDRPEVQEGEAEAAILGLHHASEWPSAEVVMDFAQYLAQRYGRDEQVTELLDNRQIWLVPVVNPDGLLFAQCTGELWRANRHIVQELDAGIDLNRNYPYGWASDPEPNPNSYGGEHPDSEPETQAVSSFLLSHQVQVLLSNHTFGNVLLYPWLHQRAGPAQADARVYQALASELAGHLGYVAGPGSELLYVAHGVLDDWAYGTLGALAFTPELGPPRDRFGNSAGVFIGELYEPGRPLPGAERVHFPMSFHPTPFGDIADQASYHADYWRRTLPAFLAVARAASEVGAVLRGRIADGAGRPLAAELTLTASYQVPGGDLIQTRRTAISNDPASGEFAWHIAPSTPAEQTRTQAYQLTVTSAGYESLTREVLVRRGDDLTVNLTLSQAMN